MAEVEIGTRRIFEAEVMVAEQLREKNDLRVAAQRLLRTAIVEKSTREFYRILELPHIEEGALCTKLDCSDPPAPRHYHVKGTAEAVYLGLEVLLRDVGSEWLDYLEQVVQRRKDA